jgi:hypothetical protein
MGLDMYLNARKYVSQVKYVDGDKIPVEDFSTLVDMSGVGGLTKYSLFGGAEISYPVGQWRKANAIHGWFVNNLADGVDECQPIEASRDHLKLLLTACKEVLAETDQDEKEAKAEDVGLSPTSGFFFGTYELDEYYDADLKYTIEMLEHVLSLIAEDDYNWNFIYQASW